MMTLFWFLAVTAACIGIARYNEDDSLFWKLWLSFNGAFAAGLVVKNTIENDKEQDKVVMIQSMPTQVLSDVPTLNSLVTNMSLSAPKREKSPKPVSKVMCSMNNNNVLSEVHSSARGQPHYYMYFSDS
jgi:hypothetical protein